MTAGDACVNCGHGLEVERGIEVGHIFKLGYKYSDAMDIRVSGPDGKPVKPIMGCYGIGVERALATGNAELTDRAAGTTVPIPLDAELPKHVREAVASAV